MDSALVHLSVVMPAFNEERRIGAAIVAVSEYLDTSGRPWELVVVDDGSTDGTVSVVRALVELDPRITMIRLGRNRGKGHALRVGVLASRGTDVLVSDADLSTPIAEVETLWAVGRDAVAVIGSRALAGSRIEAPQNRVRQLLGRLGNRYIRAVAVPSIRDTQCGFKLLRGQAARALMRQTRLNGWGIDVEMLHLCARFGWPVVEVPVRWRHRTGSKLHPIAYLRVLAEVAYVRIVHRHARATAAPSDRYPGGHGAVTGRPGQTYRQDPADLRRSEDDGGTARFCRDARIPHGTPPPRGRRAHAPLDLPRISAWLMHLFAPWVVSVLRPPDG